MKDLYGIEKSQEIDKFHERRQIFFVLHPSEESVRNTVLGDEDIDKIRIHTMPSSYNGSHLEWYNTYPTQFDLPFEEMVRGYILEAEKEVYLYRGMDFKVDELVHYIGRIFRSRSTFLGKKIRFGFRKI